MPLTEEQVIQSARESIARVNERQAKSLNLYGMRLRELPKEVLDLPENMLTSLNLGGNRMKTLPAQLKAKQSKVTKLTLSENRELDQESVLDLVSSLTLKEFVFSQNVAQPLPLLESLSKSTETLEVLDLGDLPITGEQEIAKVLSSLPQFLHLSNLILCSVGWTEFPVQLTALSNLKELDLSYNFIGTLPHEAGKFESLSLLLMDGCRLKKVEEGVCQLKSLKRLSLNYNELSELPDNLGQLESLEVLLLLYNNFDAVPSVLTDQDKRPPALQGVNLNGNLIEELIQCEDGIQSLPFDSVQTPSLILEEERQGPDTLHKLYLGCANSARNKHFLRSQNIRSILVVGSGLNQLYENFTYHQCVLDDDESEDIAQFFTEGTQFIHTRRRVGAVLVHCAAGISRSASMVIAYLIRYRNMKYERAFELVKQQRDIICPNSAFVEQLQRYTPEGSKCTIS